MRWPWSKRRAGLAFSGGAVRGLAHLGVTDELFRIGVRPAYISGTSAGAVIGALVAAGIPLNRLIGTVADLHWTRLVRPARPGRCGILSLAPMENLLASLLGEVTRFEDLQTPFVCIATDIERDQQVIFDKGPLIPALLASCAVPGIFTPVEIDGRLLSDGGVVNNLPVKILQEMGATYVIAVDLLPARTGPHRPANLLELLANTFYNLVRTASQEAADAEVVIVPEIRDFGFGDLRHRWTLIDRGRQAARAHGPRILADLGLAPRPAPWRRLRRKGRDPLFNP